MPSRGAAIQRCQRALRLVVVRRPAPGAGTPWGVASCLQDRGRHEGRVNVGPMGDRACCQLLAKQCIVCQPSLAPMLASQMNDDQPISQQIPCLFMLNLRCYEGQEASEPGQGVLDFPQAGRIVYRSLPDHSCLVQMTE